MKKTLFTIVMTVITLTAYCQQTGSNEVWTQFYHTKLHSFDYTKFEGSPYVTKAFLPGIIYNGTTVQNPGMGLRYNIYTDVIEVEDPTKKTKGPHNTILKMERIHATIAGRKYVYLPEFKKIDGTVGTYVEVLKEEANYKIYKKNNVRFQDEKKASSSYEKDKPATFKQSEAYYIADANGSLKEIATSKRRVIKAFGNMGKDLKSFISKNNIDLTEEKDIIMLATFIGSKY